MELSVFTAKILALIYLSAGVAALTGQLTFRRIIEDFEKSRGLTFVTGFLTLILGMTLVTYHNFWVKDWRTLITLIGWAALLKGLMLIAFPARVSSLKYWYKSERPWGILMIFLGLLFGYFGFFI
jgi:hypothetical protein